MKRGFIVILLTCLIVASKPASSFAVQNEVLEDAVLSILFPSINSRLYKIFGPGEQYNCAAITNIKKKYNGTYVFEATIQLVAYKQNQQPPYTLVKFNFTNDNGEWNIRSVTQEPIQTKTTSICRPPV
ncbi:MULTISPECIES: DUF3888 domain-containing protein [unclassified Bacillus (in: firmicutes)]|uniref:DUF3888 domain-containing protein n=1 Tax=unclassified Bacillus (in: firmicutes) TaxID=185979 RepID=UPI000BF04345|nr:MULTISPECIES: DUF3888 domain-containing protein [unclassified Bacillus (in: firmicutes)]PEJ48527.1 hypothetical protein CN692_24045 [Bacillus sp. AFS002410]PEK99895.1 hypothetical protein CN601_22835 [Bacillus sp. AFS017336]